MTEPTWGTSRCRSRWTSVQASRAATTARPERVVLVFLDGVGIGPDDPEVNPFLSARLPTLLRLAGGEVPTLGSPPLRENDRAVVGLDATFGVAGLPQSGTGQTALLTGLDATALFGRHFGPWIPVNLRPLVRERSLLRRAADAGRAVAFANAYPRGWPGARGSRRVAGPPLAAQGAGVLDRHEEALAREEAVASEIVNDGWRTHLGMEGLPRIGPERAGRTLARIAAGFDLTLYAHYATDTAGHRRDLSLAVSALERVDSFLGGLLEGVPSGTLVVVASDHGNIEDARAGHTRNPALTLAVGPGAGAVSELSDLRDVVPFLLRALAIAG